MLYSRVGLAATGRACSFGCVPLPSEPLPIQRRGHSHPAAVAAPALRLCWQLRPFPSANWMQPGGSRPLARRLKATPQPNTLTSPRDSDSAKPGFLRIHYHRNDQDYNEWGLHVWGDVVELTTWEGPLPPSGSDSFGVYWDVAVKTGASLIQVLVHRGDLKDCTTSVDVGGDGPPSSAWLITQSNTAYTSKPDLGSIPQGDLGFNKAFWVLSDTLAWNGDPTGVAFALWASWKGELWLSARGVEGGEERITLELDPKGLPDQVKEKFPHVASFAALRVRTPVDVSRLAKSQLALAISDAVSGQPIDATGLQIAGALDDAFAYTGPLGAVIGEDDVSVHVWAPTAQSVRLLLFSQASGGVAEESIEMTERDGAWSVTGPLTWKGRYYLFEVRVFHYLSRRVENCLSTDPYSRGLSANGERSLICDLADGALAPAGWAELASEKRPIAAPIDISVYELHIRDFSATDESVAPTLRGGYLAFAVDDSAGTRHLKALAEAGLTHLHLLPSYDFATVNELKETWKHVDRDLSGIPPDSEEQQAAVTAIQNEDAYNWGYDPVHWGVPDGSYASTPDGPIRTLEFRTMVQAVNRMGLRVVLDVVYNHVFGSGPTDRFSNLDKIVPGYYLRRNLNGGIETSTCMNNTASEHSMLSRLIVDDLVHWAVAYKVDGFRFDLMGHIMKSTLVEAQSRLRALTIEHDGVDGSSIYLYGEGWNFGEVLNNARGVTGAQRNLAGTGIGSFNDRLRDMGMGGSPFGDPQLQGFLTGLFTQPNGFPQGDEEEMEKALRAQTDCIQLSLAANLSAYRIVSYEGREVSGDEIRIYDGVPCAYTASPEELVNYVSAHDNETLFDNFAIKMSRSASLEERCRMNHMATALVGLAQGVPFFHAGDDMLRSKSLDRDSYNSGDWFNRLDFSYASNNWGVGLPPKEKNGHKWDFMRALLSAPELAPSKELILKAVANLREILAIRYSSPLFRLRTGAAVIERLRFLNTGPKAIPGVIAMALSDGGDTAAHLEQLDPTWERVVIIFNARPSAVVLEVAEFVGMQLKLHPVLQKSHDEIVKESKFDAASSSFHVPARTSVVFVLRR